MAPSSRKAALRTLRSLGVPSPNISRWVTRRKAEVVAAVSGGLLTRKAACDRYSLSDEEYETWEKLYNRHGTKGLRTTRLQQYRS